MYLSKFEELKNVKQLLRKYQVPNSKKAIIQLLNTLLPFIAIWIFAYLALDYSMLISVLLLVFNGFLMARIFIIQHDCGHGSFFKSKKWNTIIGNLCSLFTSMPFNYWAKVHDFHHGHVGRLEEEVRDIGDIHYYTVTEYFSLNFFKKLKYRIIRTPFFMFVVSPVVYLSISNRFPFYSRFKSWRKIRISQIWSNVMIVGFYVLLGYLLGWKAFLFLHLGMVFIFGIVAFWFFYVQHQHENNYKALKEKWDFVTAAILGSTYYKVPRILQWLTGNINFHHIHHLNPRIPNYYLEKCSLENPVFDRFVPILGFWESFKTIRNKLWHEETQRMITWAEYRILKPQLAHVVR